MFYSSEFDEADGLFISVSARRYTSRLAEESGLASVWVRVSIVLQQRHLHCFHYENMGPEYMSGI